MEIDLPDVLAEVTAQFARYEAALVSNDVAVLGELFRVDPRTLRYGIAENLYGYEAIASFRAARSPVGLMRRTAQTVITSYGRDTAVASTLFYRYASKVWDSLNHGSHSGSWHSHSGCWVIWDPRLIQLERFLLRFFTLGNLGFKLRHPLL